MIYLILCIISSTLIFVIFKIAGIKKIDNYSLITINYFVATMLGFSLGGIPKLGNYDSGWFIMALITGILFILIFVVMAVTTQKSGMAVSTIASKMSVAVPISFSILVFNETVSLFKIFSILIALVAVLLTIYRKNSGKAFNTAAFLLPVILFLGTGTIDSLVKYSQEKYVTMDDSIQFSSVLFAISAITGLIILLFRPDSLRSVVKPRVLTLGLILGVINFGSLYGLINALGSDIFESSVLFGINNICIVMLSVILALILFRERLQPINKVGIVLSVIAIILLSTV